ncbi:MAG: type II secretion system F family protein [Acidobacteria bacterium]|nr:type II secretion system F family protein [Acidobacteriota bacterium]
MLAALIVAFLLVAGAPWWVGIVVGAWLVSPLLAGAGLAVGLGYAAVQRTKAQPKRRLLMCVDIVSAELRSGRSLRHAFATGARDSGVAGWQRVEARALAGLPIGDVGAALTDTGRDGERVRAVLAIADSTGGEAALIFEGLADTMRGRESLDRERRMATAQARFSAGVIAGGPLVALVWLLLTGALGRLLSGGGIGAGVVVVGTALEILGVGLVVWMIVREETQ